MGEEKQDLEFEITIKERTSWRLTHKAFTNHTLNPNRVIVFIEFVNYISKNYPEDYRKAVKIL